MPNDNNSAAKMRRFLEKYEWAEISGFYWATGESGNPPIYDWYCCVALAAAKLPRGVKRIVIELRATSPYQLHNRMAEAGLNGGAPKKLKELCESAPRSPRILRKRSR